MSSPEAADFPSPSTSWSVATSHCPVPPPVRLGQRGRSWLDSGADLSLPSLDLLCKAPSGFLLFSFLFHACRSLGTQQETTSSCNAGYTARDPELVGEGIIPGGKARRREMGWGRWAGEMGDRAIGMINGCFSLYLSLENQSSTKDRTSLGFLAELELRNPSHL